MVQQGDSVGLSAEERARAIAGPEAYILREGDNDGAMGPEDYDYNVAVIADAIREAEAAAVLRERGRCQDAVKDMVAHFEAGRELPNKTDSLLTRHDRERRGFLRALWAGFNRAEDLAEAAMRERCAAIAEGYDEEAEVGMISYSAPNIIAARIRAS